jgi:hypothetical protein
MGEVKEMRVRVKPEIIENAREAGYSPEELAQMVKSKDPELERIKAEDVKRAKRLRESIPEERKKILQQDLPKDLSDVEGNHVGKKEISFEPASQGEPVAIGSDGLVIVETTGSKKSKRELTTADAAESNIAEAPGSSIASGMPISEPSGKAPEVVLTDEAAQKTVDSLVSADITDLSGAAKDLASSAEALTPAQGEEILASTYSSEPGNFMKDRKLSPSDRKKISAMMADGLSDMEIAAAIRDPNAIDYAATTMEEAPQNAVEAQERGEKILWQDGLSAESQRRALEATDALLDPEKSMLSKIENLRSDDLITAAASVSKKLPKIDGDDEVTPETVLSRAVDAVKHPGEGNFYSNQFFMELLQNGKMRGHPDVMEWLQRVFSDTEMNEPNYQNAA